MKRNRTSDLHDFQLTDAELATGRPMSFGRNVATSAVLAVIEEAGEEGVTLSELRAGAGQRSFTGSIDAVIRELRQAGAVGESRERRSGTDGRERLQIVLRKA